MEAKGPDSPMTWQDVLLAAIPSGVDVHQIDRQLTLTPTERLERMRDVLLALRSGIDGNDCEPPQSSSDPR